MKRSLLAGVGAAAACGVVLYLLIGGHDDSSSAASKTSVDHPVRDVPATAPRPTLPAPTVARDVPADPQAPTETPTMEYQREDGSLVRDHRTGANAGTWIKPALPYPTQSPVSANVTAAVMDQVRPIVLKCMNQVPESAFGQQPVVVTRVKLQIDDKGNLSALELGPAVDQIDPAASAQALDCIKQQAANVHAHVDDASVPSATVAITVRPLDYRHHQ